MWKISVSTGALLMVAACGHVSEYEKAVSDMEPVYCYQSIGKASCYDKPKHADERRLVNYFGPSPIRYDRPERPEERDLAPPPEIKTWVKDAEPIVMTSAQEQAQHRDQRQRLQQQADEAMLLYRKQQLLGEAETFITPLSEPEKISFQTLLEGVERPRPPLPTAQIAPVVSDELSTAPTFSF